jgi:hypothetical protein
MNATHQVNITNEEGKDRNRERSSGGLLHERNLADIFWQIFPEAGGV